MALVEGQFGHLHTMTAILWQKKTPGNGEKEVGWVPEVVWMVVEK